MGNRLLVDVEAVGNEREGYADILGLAGGIDEELEVGRGVRRTARMLPGVHVAARALQHDAESDVFLSHDLSPEWELGSE